MDERFDSMRAELGEAVVEQAADRFGHQPLPLAGAGEDVADLQPVVARLAVVVVDHADAAVVVLFRHAPGEIFVWARRLGENPHPALALRLRPAGPKIPEPHRLLVAEAGVQALRIARLESAEAEPFRDDLGMVLVWIWHEKLRTGCFDNADGRSGRKHSRTSCTEVRV